jgi:hypothetical protein
MLNTLFIGIVIGGFSLFIAVLLWAQIATPTLAQRNREANSGAGPSDD